MVDISLCWRNVGCIVVVGSVFFLARPVWAQKIPHAQTMPTSKEIVALQDSAATQAAIGQGSTAAPAMQNDLVLADEAPLPSTLRASLKTIAFQTAANLSDTFIFGAITGISATTGVAFFIANYASALVAYFPYELAWDALGPSQDEITGVTYAVKATGYQAVTALRNLGLSYVFTGAVSTAFVGMVLFVDAGIYIFNEYAWDILSPRAEPKEAVVTQETTGGQMLMGGSAAEVAATETPQGG